MAARKQKTKDYLLKLHPLHPKKKGEIERVYVKGATTQFTSDTMEGQGIHLEVIGADGGTVFAIPAFRLISIEDTSSVRSEGVPADPAPQPSNVVPLLK